MNFGEIGHVTGMAVSAVIGYIGAGYMTSYISNPLYQIAAGAVVFALPIWVIKGESSWHMYARLILATAGLVTLVRGIGAQFNIAQLASLTNGVL